MNLGAIASRLARLEQKKIPKGVIPSTLVILSEGHDSEWDMDSIRCRIEAGDPREDRDVGIMNFSVEEGNGPGAERITYRDHSGRLFEIGQCAAPDAVPQGEYIAISPVGDEPQKFEVPAPRVTVTEVIEEPKETLIHKSEPASNPEEPVQRPAIQLSVVTELEPVPDLEPAPGTRDYLDRWGTRWPLNTD